MSDRGMTLEVFLAEGMGFAGLRTTSEKKQDLVETCIIRVDRANVTGHKSKKETNSRFSSTRATI